MKQETIDSFLEQLFSSHHVEGYFDEGWFINHQGMPKLRGRVVQEWDHGTSFVIQFDLELLLTDGRRVIESFAGHGVDRDQAVKSGIHQFVINSFHVLLAGFYDQVDPEQIAVETWNILGQPWQLFIGNYGVKYFGTGQLSLPEDLFSTLEQLLKNEDLSTHTHWLRCFCAQHDRKMMQCEVLLDNVPWNEAQEKLWHLDWLMLDEYYSVRNFLVLKPEGE